VRRTLEGPQALGSGVGGSELGDDAINGVIADAVANLILFTGGLFGHTLEVTERDEAYMAPSAWRVDPELSEAEASLVALQAALDYFFFALKGMKVSETIKDEATEWSYSVSANALTEFLKLLRSQRDQLIGAINQGQGLEAWINLLAVRDAVTTAAIEPYSMTGADLHFDTSLGAGRGGMLMDPRGFF
jgi:hypothetical protein